MAKDDAINQYDYSFSVLQEQVSADDLFEDKTHERIASTLKAFISNTDAGLTIGLEGGWGAGKSTVINILKNKLIEDKTNTLFFVFDAWAHDGDPLRKIFLESLIVSIDSNQQDQILNSLREQVSARKKSVSVKTKKTASKLGKILSFTALLIPVGAALLSAVNYEKLVWPWTEKATEISFTFIFGLIFSFAPILAIIYWFFRGEKDFETKKIKWDIFESNSEESYTQDITEDSERTSIEFEKFFNQIMNHVLVDNSQYNYKKVLIVIDNLDRVEAEHAKNIWSTLQTFFQHRSSTINEEQYQWRKKLWFLIPYDRDGIKKVWSASNTDEKSNCKVTSSFMEKCFQVITEVPTPVMSAWMSYLEHCIEQSFTGWSVNDKKEFNESYVRCMSKLEDSPSPRQIHNHVNRAGMLGMHWKNTVSPEALCLYMLYRQYKSETELRLCLLQEGLPDNYPNQRSINELKPQLAGMLFGVNSEKGMQLLLKPEIKLALKNGDGKILSELADTHNKAFWLAFRASSNEWMITESHNDEYKLNTIDALYTAFKNSKINLFPFIYQIESAMINSLNTWNLSDYSYKEATKAISEILPENSSFLSNLNKKLYVRLNKSINSIDKDDFPSDDLDSLAELEFFLKESGNPIKTFYYTKMDITNWLKWLKKCEQKNIQFQSVLPKKETFEQLVSSAGFNLASLNNEIFQALLTTYKIHSNNNMWKELPNALISWFNLSNRDTVANEQYSLAIKLLATATKEHVKNIKDCIKSPAFWTRGSLSDISDNLSLPFLVALTVTNFRDLPFVSQEVKDFLSEDLNNSDTSQGYQYFKDANDLISIWRLATIEENIFARQILNSTSEEVLYAVGANFVDDIPWDNDEQTSSAILKLCQFGAFKEIEDKIKAEPQLYHRTIFLLQNYGDSQIKKFILKLVKSLSREQWLDALKNNNDLLNCIPDKNSSFGKAWVDYFKLIVCGEQPEPEIETLKSHYELRIKVLDLDSVYSELIAKKYFEDKENDHLSDEAFYVISPLFLPAMNKVDQKDYEVRLSNWIETDSTLRLKWFLDAQIGIRETPTESIIADVKTKLKDHDNEYYSLYMQLNDKLNLGIVIDEQLTKIESEQND
ncbi:P-loop NTPase fold protein [Shewanella baltica]|uniref:P-loop NTPase fold protein n=1 Tax=Shewanella baltica TaxID=62322 RepID=UPI00325D9012